MLRIYDHYITEERLGLVAQMLSEQLFRNGIQTEARPCLCMSENLSNIQLEGVVLLHPGDDDHYLMGFEPPCWIKLRKIIAANPNVPVYILAIGKTYRRKIGLFPNVKYIENGSVEEVLDEMIERSRRIQQ